MDTPETTVLRRTPKQARGERRIETILLAAAELFDEIGYESATTILIAQRAKTAVGSLYGFFPNKEAIAQALVERFTSDLHALMDGLMSDAFVQLPLGQIFDQLIDPLVQFIYSRPGFRALYLRTPQVGQRSAAQQGLEDFFLQRIAALLLIRYQDSKPAEARRVAKVCIETIKALTALAIQSGKIDKRIVADLKTMLRACVEAAFEQPKKV